MKQDEMKYSIIPASLDIKAIEGEEGPGQFTGLASAFHNLDAVNDIMASGAFSKDLEEFLRDGFIAGINHDWSRPIGRPSEAKETRDGLEITARLSDTEAGREVRTLTKDGVLRKMSIGYRVIEGRRLSKEEVSSYWKSVGYSPSGDELKRSSKGAILLTRVQLFEVSPVTVPANPKASITGAKSLGIELADNSDKSKYITPEMATAMVAESAYIRDRIIRSRKHA